MVKPIRPKGQTNITKQASAARGQMICIHASNKAATNSLREWLKGAPINAKLARYFFWPAALGGLLLFILFG